MPRGYCNKNNPKIFVSGTSVSFEIKEKTVREFDEQPEAKFPTNPTDSAEGVSPNRQLLAS